MAYVIISDEATPLLYGGFTFKALFVGSNECTAADVLGSLRFPRDMEPAETILAAYLCKAIQDFDISGVYAANCNYV